MPRTGPLSQNGAQLSSPDRVGLERSPCHHYVEVFEKAQLQLRRNAEVARKMYQPASRRYLLRTLVNVASADWLCEHLPTESDPQRGVPLL